MTYLTETKVETNECQPGLTDFNQSIPTDTFQVLRIAILTLHLLYIVFQVTPKRKEKKNEWMNDEWMKEWRLRKPYNSWRLPALFAFLSQPIRPYSSLIIKMEAAIVEVSTVKALMLRLIHGKCMRGNVWDTWMATQHLYGQVGFHCGQVSNFNIKVSYDQMCQYLSEHTCNHHASFQLWSLV